MDRSSLIRQRGVALLAALILMLALVLTLGTIFYRHQLDVAQAAGILHGDQALLMALSAENWARDLLSARRDNRDVDSLDEDWAQAVPTLPLEGGYVRGCLVDLQGKININDLAAYDAERWKTEFQDDGNGIAKTYLKLLESLGLAADPVRVARVIDWLDDDSEPLNQWGAEQPVYDFLTPPTMVANAKMVAVDELAAVDGYDLYTTQLLYPWLTALPVDTTININTAPPQILTALGGAQGETFLQSVLENRPFENLADFYQTLGATFGLDEQQARQRWPENLLSVKSDFFQLNLEVSLGDAVLEVRSVLDRHQSDNVAVISREISVVPPIADKDARLKVLPLCALQTEDAG